MRSKPFSIYSRIPASLTPRRSIKKQASAITASQVRNGGGKARNRSTVQAWSRSPAQITATSGPVSIKISLKIFRTFANVGDGWRNLRAAFDDAAHILDQTEGR